MKDPDKILRHAIFNILNGSVSKGVYDEKRPSTSTSNMYVLLSTQQQVENDTSDAFMTDCTIDIEVCQMTGSEVSKDEIDDLAEEVMEILFPTAWTDELSASGVQIQNLRRIRSITRALEISPTESILRKILTIQAIIVQQF